MKRMSFLLLIIVALITPPAINAYAAEPILACETSTNGPTTGTARGELLTAKATMLGNAISVAASRWEPNDNSLAGSLTNYFVYTRKVGEIFWKCTYYNYTLMTVAIENSANDYEVAVVAYAGGWWSNVVNLKVPGGVNNIKQVCPPEYKYIAGLSGGGYFSAKNYQVNAYSKNSNRFWLTLMTDYEQSKGVSYGDFYRYIFEYSINNWKSKAMIRADLYNLVGFKPLSQTAAHKVRAYVDVSSLPTTYVQKWVPNPKSYKLGEWVDTDQKIKFTTEGCKSNEAIFYPREVKESSDICTSGDSNCAVELVPGENADIGAKTQETTIKCTKGKLVKNITGTKPKCPTGYKVSK